MELERRFNSFGCLLFNNFNACAADDGLCCFACFKRIVEEEAEDAMVLEVEGRFMPYDVLILFEDGTSRIYAEVRQ